VFILCYKQCEARSRVADGDGLQVWMVAANIVNKHSRTTAMDRPPGSGLGHGLTIPHRNKTGCYEMLHWALNLLFKRW